MSGAACSSWRHDDIAVSTRLAKDSVILAVEVGKSLPIVAGTGRNRQRW
jgi:hypothetical protein